MYSKFYTEQRVRSFRRRKGLSDESITQGILVVLVLVVASMVVMNYMEARQELATAKVQYSNIVEAK